MPMPADRKVTVTISNRTIVRAILWIVAAVVLFNVLGRLTHALTLLFISFFLALALNPVVSWISRRLRIKSRVRATALAYVGVVVFLVGFFALVTPPLIKQTRDFINDAPQIVSNFQNQDNSLAKTVRRYNLDDKMSKAARDFASQYSNFGNTILNTGKRVAAAIISALAVIIMTFMMLVEGPRWLDLIWGALPDKNRRRRQKLAQKMYRAVTGFVIGQVILASLAGSFTLVALLIASNVLDVSINAVALAGIVALLALIPMIGNLVSATIVVLVCLLNSVNLAVVMLIYFIVYQQLENMTLQPYIQARQNQLTPLLVFAAALIGIGFGGILGAFVAIPTASCIKILIEDYFERHQGKPAPETV